MPKVSIITASYNYEHYIKETIESVIAQSYKDWEMIIVDDGSKDNSVSVIKEYCLKDDRIKFFQHENGVNKGLAETIQLGLQCATGEWIVFLESDDSITPDYLEEKLQIANNNPDVNLIFNDINLFGDEEKIKNFNEVYILLMKKQLNITGQCNKLINLFRNKRNINFIPTFSVVMIKPALFQNIDFNSPNKPALDFYLWLQIVKKCKFYFIDKKLTNWRMHKDSYIGTKIDIKSKYNFDRYRINCLYGKFGFFINLMNSLKYYRKKLIMIHSKEIILLNKIKIKNNVRK